MRAHDIESSRLKAYLGSIVKKTKQEFTAKALAFSQDSTLNEDEEEDEESRKSFRMNSLDSHSIVCRGRSRESKRIAEKKSKFKVSPF
jgi:hypothetical protein